MTTSNRLSQHDDRNTIRLRWIVLPGLSLLLGMVVGCAKPPQVGAANLDLIEALATATSTQKPELIERCSKMVEERSAQGKLGREQADEFSAIFALARAGDWDKARDRAYAFRDAQQPEVTGEVERKLPELKKPGTAGR